MTGTLRGVSNKHCLLSFFSFFIVFVFSKSFCLGLFSNALHLGLANVKIFRRI